MSTSRVHRHIDRSEHPGGAAGSALGEVPSTRLGLRRHQRISLGPDGSDHVFLLERGCLTYDVHLAGGRRQVLLVLYPGDAIARRSVPPLPLVGLTAAAPSTVRRLPPAAGNTTAGSALTDGAAAELAAAADRLMARASMHAVMIGRLSGEQRLATFLVEAALCVGFMTQGRCSFDLPLSRSELADYLALNPDTLSRLMSRLRSRSLLTMPSRGRVVIDRIDALTSITPLAAALQSIHARNLAPV